MAALARRLRRGSPAGRCSRAEIDQLLGKGRGHAASVCGSTSSGSRPRAPGSDAEPTCTRPRRSGWGRRRSPRRTRLEHLVRRYLGGFGPASRSEIADWAGLRAERVAPALERLRLRRFRAEDGEELLDLPRAPLPDPETPAPARFLPVWDATLLVHARRTGILPERYRPVVFNTKPPTRCSTFLVDGEVAGTWQYEPDGSG